MPAFVHILTVVFPREVFPVAIRHLSHSGLDRQLQKFFIRIMTKFVARFNVPSNRTAHCHLQHSRPQSHLALLTGEAWARGLQGSSLWRHKIRKSEILGLLMASTCSSRSVNVSKGGLSGAPNEPNQPKAVERDLSTLRWLKSVQSDIFVS